MKRVRCPKCDHYLTFDETRYTEGQTIVFECPECHRQFGARIGVSKFLATRKDERRLKDEDAQKDIYTGLTDTDSETQQDCGSLIVIENVFHFKQTLPLRLGDNVIGRYVKGSNINTPIETVDPSMDSLHCTLTVSRDRQGQLKYTLKDGPSYTGTFVGDEILGDRERRIITDGQLFTLGATSIILRTSQNEQED